VLVVDDNEMNLKVARGLLEPLHLNIDTAANGKQAVGMVQNRHYDIVFMDHMMPVMDGIEATREIRKLEGDYYQSLPIIALSANATTEAREMFTKEGLDDFVAKPIQMKDICRCILRWLPRELVERQETSALDGGAGEGPAEDVEAIGDLDVAEGIRNCGTKKLFTSLLGDFYKLIDSKSTKLDKCLEDGMVRDYTIEVHALKNTARMIGATELSDMFYRMEQLGNEQNVDEIRRLHPALMERYRGYKPVLREYASSDNEDKENVSPEVIKDTLMKLHDAMDSFDLDGADEAMKLLETYAFPEDMQDKVTELSAYVADVAMEDVMRLTEELAREMR
jgi:CheY-like chemotaxis protein/HPt (histidine-containing phosphotransfer) domain-containing protein